MLQLTNVPHIPQESVDDSQSDAESSSSNSIPLRCPCREQHGQLIDARGALAAKAQLHCPCGAVAVAAARVAHGARDRRGDDGRRGGQQGAAGRRAGAAQA